MDKKLFNQLTIISEKLEKSEKIVDRFVIPKTGGIYLIKKKKNNKIEYIGKATNLYRRINSDHVSGEQKISTSTFRRKVAKKYNKKSGKILRQYILDNYDFYILAIDNFDMRSLIESYLIYKYRKLNNLLLNDIK